MTEVNPINNNIVYRLNTNPKVLLDWIKEQYPIIACLQIYTTDS